MREIKFRAWDGEKMLKNIPIESVTLSGDLDFYGTSLSVMQFTGLHDKNGKEIYEGDIVFKFGIDDAPYVVKFGEQSIGHDWLGIGFFTEHRGEQDNIFGGKHIKIIGNIYENPELTREVK